VYVTLAALKQFRTPNFLATGGKMRNWMKQPKTPYMVNSVPIRFKFKPKPPLNLNGRWVLCSFGSLRGKCMKIGSI